MILGKELFWGGKGMSKKKNKQKASTTDREAKQKKDNPLRDSSMSDSWFMSRAPKIDEEFHGFQLLPIAFFTAVIILITQMASYRRPMAQFFWYSAGNELTDYFSYYKMVAIIICGVLALLILLYRVFDQSLSIKASPYYIPMAIYSLFVILSYILSDYREFALLGWNGRFEGTLVVLSYMVLLFYILNTINTERAVKWVVYPTAVSSAILGLLGVSQALGKDFFKSTFGQKLITPNSLTESGETLHQLIDAAKESGESFLNFQFTNNEIYQTVFNPNYVSFYLTLLIPLFGLIFIRSIMMEKEEPLWTKTLWAILFAILLFNLIGSASSGGYLGLGATFILAIVMLNKTLVKWWKPLLILLAITIIVAGATSERWLPEITGAIRGVVGKEASSTAEEPTGPIKVSHSLDSILTMGSDVIIEIDGNEMIISLDPQGPPKLAVRDKADNPLELTETDPAPIFTVNDKRFDFSSIQPGKSQAGYNYFTLSIENQEQEWTFWAMGEGAFYGNELGKLVKLERVVPSIGWQNNLSFGTGRGYIWSRTLPLMKETLIIGQGADTYCLYFPHQDYVGKYNSGYFANKINTIVDKPHNMYMGMWVGTGMISVLAFMAILLIYIIQSIRIYWKIEAKNFTEYVGYGIFLGIIAFCVSGLVNDSSVSVMPMFYGLLGVGMGINQRLNRIGF